MQVDMHYYGTYAMALAAGIPDPDASVIAYAAQYVDDATSSDSRVNKKDGGLLVGFTTAHHAHQTILPGNKDPIYQRKVWVPCHFIPGGEGSDMEQKSVCVKNSPIAREMVENHIGMAAGGKKFGLELIGIAAHAYMDTFAHYGFSGFGSSYNSIDTKTLRIWTNDDNEYDRLKKKFKLLEKGDENLCLDETSIFSKLMSKGAQLLSSSLGHGGVLSFPDRPYLRWEFEYELPRPGNGTRENRENYKDYLQGCRELHSFFSGFARKRYAHPEGRAFDDIKGVVSEILRIEADKEARSEGWKRSGLVPGSADYSELEWESQKKGFDKYADSSVGMDTSVYRFHQAAAYHRYYMLKDLLPKHGIAAH
jgi:hypothetical protein